MAGPTNRDKHFKVEAFLKQMAAKETIDFFGVEIETPTDVPLSFTLRWEEIQNSSAEDASNLLKLLGAILGDKVAEKLEEADPGVRALGALLHWAFSNSQGTPLTYPEAYEKFLETEAENRRKVEAGEADEGDDDAGKPSNRSERRAATRSGGKSKTTSR